VKESLRYSALLAVAALVFACGGGEGGAPAAEEEAAAPAPETAGEAVAETGEMEALELPEGVTPEMVARGKEIFAGAGICYTCHGPEGQGGPLAPSLQDEEWINIDGSYEAIVNTVTTGVAQPKQFPGIMLPKAGTNISDEDVRAVAAYVWTLSHKD